MSAAQPATPTPATGDAAGVTAGDHPPVARRVRVERRHHGDVLVDDHDWLRDEDDPAVRALVDAENAWASARTAHLAGLREQLFEEVRARTQESDLSVPAREGGWWYYRRTTAGQQHPALCRVAVSAAGGGDGGDGADGGWEPPVPPADGAALPGEQVLLDVSALAAGHDFFALGAATPSPDGTRLAWSADTTGDERFVLRVRDLATGADLPEAVPGTGYGAAWAADSATVLYTAVDDAWRPHEVRRHRVGLDAPDGSDDAVVAREDDERYWLGVEDARTGRHLVITSASKDSSEVSLLDAARPEAGAVMVVARRPGVDVSVEPAVLGGRDVLLVLHDDGALDFELAVLDVAEATAPGADPATAHERWRVLVPHVAGRRLEGVDAFDRFLALSYRRDALPRVAVLALGADGAVGAPVEVGAPDGLGDRLTGTSLGSNRDAAAPLVRVEQTSFTVPPSVLDVPVPAGGPDGGLEPDLGEPVLRRRTPVLGGYDPAAYTEERTWATAADGARVPVSVVARAGTARDGSAPGLLYGYGSYEVSTDPWFSTSRTSLLDRGAVVAVAHVRGGGELGRAWYEDGRRLAKANTFSDFTAAARHLVAGGWVDGARLVAEGGSAGGLLVGAAMNLEPELFAGVLAAVPFVDPLTTMLDESLPLTVVEQEEWGDPIRDPAAYAVMKAYAPVENLPAPARVPAVLATAGLHDTRVSFVEPAKWVARMRAQADDGAPRVLLRTEVAGGHGGRSGRYEAWRERAWELAWVLDVLGLAGQEPSAPALPQP